MIVIHVLVSAKTSTATALEQVLRAVCADARRLPGCTRYQWYSLPDEPGKYAAYGEFESLDSFARYRQSDVVKRIVGELIPLLASVPEYRHYEATILEGS